jgi:mannose-6-phosphate isomerase-like protein (cupin superfamily)
VFEQIEHDGRVLAMILRASYKKEGIHFFTPDSFSQQLGYMKRPVGHVIEPHDHNPVERTVTWTQEVLFVRSGRVRLDLYDENRSYLESRVLGPGDVILLAHGGHGLVMLEESEIIEVKQGPYVGEHDKTRFERVCEEDVSICD